ncbi:hypothetical protein B0T20DRAFT_78779 [Sordaria brevicollis]|uniref:SET domain-containing protein n=1 Tax=Sordaria brevicollis TaxID=83679 RepID=A0AAE0P122_SORBR|nr:hypothetical protein B0T20DRAFT_78779 [Sordaria brevicollis]
MPPKKASPTRVTKGGRLGHGPRWTAFEAWNSDRTTKEVIPGTVCKQINSFYADPRRWAKNGNPERPRKSTLPKTEDIDVSDCISNRARLAIAEPIFRADTKYCWTCFQCGRQPDDPECDFSCYDEIHSGGGSKSMNNFFRKWLEIRHTGSEERGYGIFVKSTGRYEIPAGSYLGHYIGEIAPGPSKGVGGNSNRYLYEPQVGPSWDADRPIIDAGKMGNWTRFMNSSCNPNVGECIMQIGKVRVIAFFANKTLKSGDELCIYYGDDYFKGHDMLCSCDEYEGKHDPAEVGASMNAELRQSESWAANANMAVSYEESEVESEISEEP